MRRLAVALMVAALCAAATGAQTPPAAPRPSLSPALAKQIDPVIDAIWSHFDLRAAQEHVKFVTGYWRLPGNPGFDATIDRVHARLVASGFHDRLPGAAAAAAAPSVWVEEYPNPGKGWDHSIGTLAIVHPGKPDETVLSRANQRLALCINSFSTAPGGVTARLVDVGRGDQDADYATADLTGAVIVGDADVGQLWRRGVQGKGAIGVISGAMGDYVNPDPPGAKATPRESWNILQWGSIPYDETRKGFGFKATPHAMTTLRKALAAGPVEVRVTIASTFSSRPARTLVAEIPGAVAPNERVVLAAHVQEPGANDNASGVATLAETARALALGIGQGRIPRPGRTLTLLWLDEIAGSRQWLSSHPEEAKGVRYMFSMDMTGEDVRKTGGSFLIERYPDPGAVWDRPWDPHTEWGRGQVRADQLKGDLLNDLHLAVCLRVARKTGWVVNTNPYEGGSDHTVFGSAGIPSVLDWHFTDRYYHTNLDTADKSSAAEMRNVGTSAASTAWLLASAREPAALAIADLVAKAGHARLAFEEREGARLAAAESNVDAARLREDQIVSAWKKWYAEAVESAARVVVGPASPAFATKLDALAAPFEGTGLFSTDPGVLGTEVGRSAGGSPLPGAAIVALAGGAIQQTSPAALALAIDRLLADRWYPNAASPLGGASADSRLLVEALASSSEALRRQAVRGVGRFEDPTFVAAIAPLLGDERTSVRAEAANAIVQSLVHSRGADVLPGADLLIARVGREPDPAAAAVMRESIARLHYAGDAAAETRALAALGAHPEAVVVLLRADPKLPVGDDVRAMLKRAARPDGMTGVPSRDAIEALGLIGDADASLTLWASTYRCTRGGDDCGWEVRYAAVNRMDAADPAFDAALATARRDGSLQVRMAALRRSGAAIARTHKCGALIDTAMDDLEQPIARMEAMSLLAPACDNGDDIRRALRAAATPLADAIASGRWHVPARAFETLAKFDAGAARRIMTDVALPAAVWQVRAAAARVAAAIRDEPALVLAASDAEPNVRTEALAGLARLRSASTVDVAIRSLDSGDFQLIRQAALALQGRKDAAAIAPPMLGALARLTQGGKDTSRDPRVALLVRLKELAAPPPGGPSPLADRATELRAYLTDFDPAVAAAAADVLAVIESTRPAPAATRRAPVQPTEREVATAPDHAVFEMADGGMICTALRSQDAPVAVARFASLARAGYYANLTFHRVVSLFVIQGGSPGANEYMGDARYWRDDINLARHVRGALGLSTRGRDTADGQVFFDLTDQPRLNDDYTVIGQIDTRGPGCARSFEVMDGVLEGAKIAGVTIR